MTRNTRWTRGHRPTGKSHVVLAEKGGIESGGAGHRHVRLERILTIELAALLRDEVADPALSTVRLVSVELAPDGGHARAAYVVEGELGLESQARERTGQALVRATGFLRARLASQLDRKRTPKLSFAFVGMVAEPGGVRCSG